LALTASAACCLAWRLMASAVAAIGTAPNCHGGSPFGLELDCFGSCRSAWRSRPRQLANPLSA
jgi:hypothetical protein